MEKTEAESFGAFLQQLRKEKGLTQKELAQKLYLSDKAVSKWERGLSMPDIALLLPLSRILGVSTTELLSAKRLATNTGFTMPEVENLMGKTLELSAQETQAQAKRRQNQKLVFALSVCMLVLELCLLFALGTPVDALRQNLLTVELLMLIFGTYFTFFVRDTLPRYYDENKINFYHDGIFRLNLPGVSINNSNWPHMADAARKTLMAIMVLFPLLYLLVSRLAPAVWEQGQMIFTLGSVFSMFIPLYIVGKKYE